VRAGTGWTEGQIHFELIDAAPTLSLARTPSSDVVYYDAFDTITI
jgi:hypothetical protein